MDNQLSINCQKYGVYIIYATETGNAHELSIHACIALKHKISGIKQINQQFNFQAGNIYIAFISTTGQGDPPYSMRSFWKMFMNKSYNIPKNVKFCVYGLGDRSYGDNFNVIARKFRQRLIMLQAQQLFQIGLGDQQSSNGCFQQYFTYFFPKIENILQNIQVINYHFSIQKHKAQSGKNSSHSFQIISQQKLSQVEQRVVYWVILQQIKPQIFTVQPGDIIQLYPKNDEIIVNNMLTYFTANNLNDTQQSENDIKLYLQTVANLQNIVNFTFFATNIQGQKQLYDMVDSSVQLNIRELYKQKLQQLSTDYNQYYNYIKKYKRNVREVIADFSLKIPFSSFRKRLGVIIPRKFSVAQANTQNKTISLLIKLQTYKIAKTRVVEGFCSHDLAKNNKQSSNEVKIRCTNIIRNGQFKVDLISNSQMKIVMISLGTGIAPFIGLIEQALKTNNNVQIALFHSNRYAQESPVRKLQLSKKYGQCKKLSIFQTYTRQKQKQNRRIQFLIKQNLDIIQKSVNGKIFICGPKSFCDLICDIFSSQLNLDTKKLKKNKVICIQNW